LRPTLLGPLGGVDLSMYKSVKTEPEDRMKWANSHSRKPETAGNSRRPQEEELL